MEPADIKAYLARDWRGAERSKAEYWRSLKREQGTLVAVRAAEALRLQTRALRPAWPSDEDRVADLNNHAHLAELFARAHRSRAR